MQIYDISLPIDPALATWPGDTPFTFEWICTKAEGETVNLGSITSSLHVGTHLDAPYHFDSNGASIDQLTLGAFMGAAVVIDLSGKQTIEVSDLDAQILNSAPRIIIKTGAWKDHFVFPESIPVMSSEVPEHLRRCGIVLLGLDLPSVDPIDSKTLDNHHALHARGIHVLESLYLRDVPEGQFELIALPLRIVGADASPVRAILRSLS
jgi:arylformamidase